MLSHQHWHINPGPSATNWKIYTRMLDVVINFCLSFTFLWLILLEARYKYGKSKFSYILDILVLLFVQGVICISVLYFAPKDNMVLTPVMETSSWFVEV